MCRNSWEKGRDRSDEDSRGQHGGSVGLRAVVWHEAEESMALGDP